MNDFPGWAFFIFFILMWCSISLILSYISGWQELAKHYKTTQPSPNNMSYMKTGRIGITRFRNALNIGTTSDALYLSVFPFFRLGHPPLLIPWSAITRVEQVSRWFWLTDYYRLQVGSPRITTLMLPKRSLANVETILERRFSNPS